MTRKRFLYVGWHLVSLAGGLSASWQMWRTLGLYIGTPSAPGFALVALNGLSLAYWSYLLALSHERL